MYIKNANAKELIRDDKIILCNIRNGGFVRAPKVYFEYLRRNIEENKGQLLLKKDTKEFKNVRYLFEQLCKIGYFIKKEEYEKELNYSYDVIYLSLTNRCNLKCKHCVVSACIDESDHLNSDEWKRIIDEVITLNAKEINLTGGEPLIRPDFCELLKYLRKKYNGIITLSTNGLLITENNIKTIKENIDSVSVSLDGYDEYTTGKVRGEGVYGKVIDSIKNLKNLGINKISVSMLKTKYTYEHEEKFNDLCKRMGVKPLIRRFAPVGRGEENEEELIPPIDNINDIQKKYLKCSLCQPGRKELNISENGDVYPCAPLSGNKKLLMGNILNDSLRNIIDSKKWKLEIEKLRPWNMEKCKECNVNLFCHSCINFISGMKSNPKIFEEFCTEQRKKLERIVWGE